MSLIGCWKANNRDVLILKIVEDIREAFLEEIRSKNILCLKANLFYISNKIATYEIFQFQKIGSSRKRHGLWQ
jgi:hypothetical protein